MSLPCVRVSAGEARIRSRRQDSTGEPTALELLRSCLGQGGNTAWADFVRRFQPLLSGTVAKTIRRWTVPCPALVEDLVQDTYLKLCADNFKPLRQFTFRHENALLAFLRVIAENVVQDHFRGSWCQKRGNGRIDELSDQLDVSDRASFARQVEIHVLLQQIYDCLDKMQSDTDDKRNAAIFYLYYHQGLTADAISRLCDIDLSIKGVESTLLRLTRFIKVKLRTASFQSAQGPSSCPTSQ
jgi:RNA polymerase sigma-70 factor (ECF subfamily)